MQKGLRCTNTYQFHFFVLPMIFMPNPAAPYLCSQLASVTKGLCKPLLRANRFLPTSEETAGDAAAYLSARHARKHVCRFSFSIFFFFLLVLAVLFRGEVEREMRRMQKQESKQRQGQIQEGLGLCREPLLNRVQSRASSTIYSDLIWRQI